VWEAGGNHARVARVANLTFLPQADGAADAESEDDGTIGAAIEVESDDVTAIESDDVTAVESDRTAVESDDEWTKDAMDDELDCESFGFMNDDDDDASTTSIVVSGSVGTADGEGVQYMAMELRRLTPEGVYSALNARLDCCMHKLNNAHKTLIKA